MSEMITGGSTVAVPNHKVTKPTHYLSLVRLWLICISTILVVEDNKEIGRWIYIDSTCSSTTKGRTETGSEKETMDLIIGVRAGTVGSRADDYWISASF